MTLPIRLSANNGFVNNFSGKSPRLYLTAETDDVSEFDQYTINQWKGEGFDVSYIPYNANNESQYRRTLQDLGKVMSVGEDFAVVGRFGHPPY